MFEYKDKYCEWLDCEILDQNNKFVTKWKIRTDCGQYLIATPYNRYGNLRKEDGAICPFCGKIVDVRCYE